MHVHAQYWDNYCTVLYGRMAISTAMFFQQRDQLGGCPKIVVVVSKRSMSKIGFFHFLIVSWSTCQNELVTKRNTQICHFITRLE